MAEKNLAHRLANNVYPNQEKNEVQQQVEHARHGGTATSTQEVVHNVVNGKLKHKQYLKY